MRPGAPVLSVIVPVRNERSWIRGCLDSILADAPAGGLEVIVVDGESDDGTAEVASEVAAADARVRLLTNPSHFVPQAMNLGIAEAAGEYIGRVDGHCAVVPGYFSGCLERLEGKGYDCVGGVLINEGTTPAGRAIAAATSSAIGVGSARFRTGRGGESTVDTIAFGVYRSDVFERVGLFDEMLVRNQDDELNLRLVRAGGRILLVPSLSIRYFVRDSVRMLGRQYFQYGYWKWRVFRKHGQFASARQLAPPLFVAAVLLAALAAFFVPKGPLLLAALVVPYTLVVLGESLRLGRARQAPWWRIVQAIMTVHVAYGAGLIKAMIDAMLGQSGTKEAATRLSR